MYNTCSQAAINVFLHRLPGFWTGEWAEREGLWDRVTQADLPEGAKRAGKRLCQPDFQSGSRAIRAREFSITSWMDC